MTDLHYEYKGTNAYLVYTLNENDVIDSLSLGMLTNNEIDGIIPTQFVQMDDTKQILFNVSGRVSVAQLIKGPVNRKRLIGILSGVVTALLSADEYMLEPQSFLLELEYIFVDLKTAETAVICMPLESVANNNHSLKSFLKDIVYQTQFDQTEGYDHIAQILNYINSTSDLSLEYLKTLLMNLSNPQKSTEPVQESYRQDHAAENHSNHDGNVSIYSNDRYAASSQLADDNGDNSSGEHDDETHDEEPEISLYELLSKFNSERYEKYKAQQKRKKEKQKQKGKESSRTNKKEQQSAEVGLGFAIPGYEESLGKQSSVEPENVAFAEKIQPQPEHLNYGDTVLLEDDKRSSQVLSTGMVIQPYLIWQRNNEKVYINAEHFLIGRKQSDVNYCIRNNKTVGRVHAEIITHDGDYFVRDLGSTNHTYVNGVEIPPDQDVPLVHGSRIVFSDEEFEFNLV